MSAALLMPKKDAGISVRVDLSKFWDDELTNELVSQTTGLHKNTVSTYRNGMVLKPRIDILLAFKKFFEERIGRTIAIEEMIRWNDTDD